MCCSSRAIERVSGASVFVRAEGTRQLVVYEMSLQASRAPEGWATSELRASTWARRSSTSPMSPGIASR